MRLIASAFVVGLLFGLGLVISQMINPAKVLAFLDIFGAWDPSLALVMAGAVAAASVGFAVAGRRAAPLWAPAFQIPTRRDLDARLITGAALFGIGWGLVGLCPGPALTTLPLGLWQVVVFVAACLWAWPCTASCRQPRRRPPMRADLRPR
ncbi:DUF6691 family protein [Roseomonas genomospecies 6]|uniref:DUF6691 family protein n=1 Tax=Roseomonas genomospecies 6 TaxID=214106 RepID=UPI00256FB9E2|nr:DUF6691 family protein [Roseomonas genomospecies 6]